MIETDKATGRKKIVKDPDVSDAMEDMIQNFLTFQSKHRAVIFLKTKYDISLTYRAVSSLLKNPFLYGEYRGNPNYCEAYINKETFDAIQEILNRNVKYTTKRTYIFTGLIRCPQCGRGLLGSSYNAKSSNGTRTTLKKYRCSYNRLDHRCDFNKVVNEVTFERLMLANIKQYLEDAKRRASEIEDSTTTKTPKHDIDELYIQLDRLNYSWQTGKIRTVERYEKQFAELTEKIEEAEAERGAIQVKDFSRIDEILEDGWRDTYNKLDEEHKRAFWRSFIREIHIHWTTETKEITKIEFYNLG